MSPVNDEEMAVVRAVRQSLESDAGTPGSGVNPHPNPFFVSLNGSFDLLKIAQRVITHLDNHRNAIAARRMREAQELQKKADAERAQAEINKGAVSEIS
jgi:hypothetical protein